MILPSQSRSGSGARVAALRDDAPASDPADTPGNSFVRSLLELDNPTRYPLRPRWFIDQGRTDVGFRTGGYWGIAAVVYGLGVVALLIACQRRSGLVAGAAALGTVAFVAALPQAHDLRYYMFIPLCGAATIGMLAPRFAQLAPRLASALLALVMSLFLHMVFENRSHYHIERIDWVRTLPWDRRF